MDNLKKFYDFVLKTDLTHAIKLSKKNNNNIYLKREDNQKAFSFKIRGAYNKLISLSSEELRNGVICASAGNHAQGVAMSAKHLKCYAKIVMPITAPEVKIEAVKDLGGDVVLFGESFSDALNYAIELSKKENLTLIHAFDDEKIIEGQGTIGQEILEQLPDTDFVFVPIGGGGLISGISEKIKQINPDIKIIGVQTYDSNAMIASINQNKIISLTNVGLFADGTAIKQVGNKTYEMTKKYVDDFIMVETDEVCAAIKDIYMDTRSIVEPSGALSVAGAKKYIKNHNLIGQNFVCILSGANMNFDRLHFIVERSEENEVLLSVTCPDTRLEFKKMCEIIKQYPITEFNFRKTDGKNGNFFIGLSVGNLNKSLSLQEKLENNNFTVYDLSQNGFAKTHVRHMVGGKNQNIFNEVAYGLIFQEKPGELINILTNFNPAWNVSMLHYQNQGADYGKLLIGIECSKDDKEELEIYFKKLNILFKDECENIAYETYLK